MAEGIVFRRYVQRGLRTAVRELFAPCLTQDAVDAAVIARAKDLRRQHGIPGLQEIADIVIAWRMCLHPSENMLSVLDRIDGVCRNTGHQNTLVAAQRARLLLVDDGIEVSGTTTITRQIAEFALRDFMASGLMPKPLISELTEGRYWTVQMIERRRAEFFRLLKLSSPFEALVGQILDEPGGSRINLSPVASESREIAELVYLPLTDDGSEEVMAG